VRKTQKQDNISLHTARRTATSPKEKRTVMPGGKKYHFFWSKKGSPFSQWQSSNYTLDGYQYSTAEQGMMHGKAMLFGDEDVAAQILQTNRPREIKELGRQVGGFSEKEWKKHRENIVYRNSVAKFSQSAHLRAALLRTKGLLVDDSPSDKIWGIGMHKNEAKKVPESEWKGLNLLGKILTKVRDEIRANGGDDESSSSTPSKTRKKNAPLGAKIVYIIRHGQSEGQAVTRKERKHSSMRDCDLTRKGRKEAEGVSRIMSREDFDSIELVVSSPLTRAMHTSLLAFPTKHIMVNYDLGELGGGIPENVPRKMEEVMKDLQRPLSYRDESLLLDTTSLQPAGWPQQSTSESSKTKTRIQNALSWLSAEREESTIAVVCHYNVIREAVKDGKSLSPVNATPIRCCLYPNGELVLA
jgi:ribA/ribD-fused uncharacterized protein